MKKLFLLSSIFFFLISCTDSGYPTDIDEYLDNYDFANSVNSVISSSSELPVNTDVKPFDYYWSSASSETQVPEFIEPIIETSASEEIQIFSSSEVFLDESSSSEEQIESSSEEIAESSSEETVESSESEEVSSSSEEIIIEISSESNIEIDEETTVIENMIPKNNFNARITEVLQSGKYLIKFGKVCTLVQLQGSLGWGDKSLIVEINDFEFNCYYEQKEIENTKDYVEIIIPEGCEIKSLYFDKCK